MTRLLVVSVASINRPHRKAFDLLGRDPNWDVHIVAPDRLPISGGQYKTCDPAPDGAAYTLHTVRVYGARTARLDWFFGLAPRILKLRPDVVFLEYDPGSWPVLHAWLVRQLTGFRIVPFTVENISRDRWHDAVAHARRAELRSALRDAFIASLNWLGTYATDGLASVNDEGVRIFREERHYRVPIEVVPLGTDTHLFHPTDARDLRNSLGLEGSFVVGYFGRLIPEKGVHLLIEALPHLGPSTKLLLDMFTNFVPGSYAARLMARAEELGVRERIVTVDVGHEDVPRHMSACDVLVLPSVSAPRWREQYGRVLPEAMACRVPVIGSDSGNIPALIGDAGLVFREGDVNDLVAKIDFVRDDPEATRQRVDAGERRVHDYFSVEAQKDVLDRLLRQALSPRCGDHHVHEGP